MKELNIVNLVLQYVLRKFELNRYIISCLEEKIHYVYPIDLLLY